MSQGWVWASFMKQKWLATMIAVLSAGAILLIPGQFNADSTAQVNLGDDVTIGTEVKVPMVIRNIPYLSNARITVGLPDEESGYTYQGMKPAPLFDRDQFAVLTRSDNETVTIEVNDLVSQTSRHVTDWQIGYLLFEKTEPARLTKGDRTEVTVRSVEALQTNRGETVPATTSSGWLIHNYGPGDSTGAGNINAGTAVQILQHALGDRDLESERFAAADVTGDGRLNLDDVTMILSYLTGQSESLLSIVPPASSRILHEQSFDFSLQAVNGAPPYEWERSSGRLPNGLTLRSDGRITGEATRTGTSTVELKVTDRAGESAKKEISFTVIESDITDVQAFTTERYDLGEQPDLPEQTQVHYQDGSRQFFSVTWEEQTVTEPGLYTFSGQIDDLGIPVQIQVFFGDQAHLDSSYDISSSVLFGLHTIEIEASSDTRTVLIHDRDMHYEGQGRFSLGVTQLQSGQKIEVMAYDAFGVLIDLRIIEIP